MNGPEPGLVSWLLALSPVLVLFGLVLSNRVRPAGAAGAVLALAVGLAVTAFAAGTRVLSVAIGKGLWLGLWILLVVWPALLLYRVASVGGLERMGEFFTGMLPNRHQNLLVVSWLLPGFVQGVAGFGTPIAVAAPLLRAMGYSPVRSVVYPLIGYTWSVTFGSMGSSFYMASLTARLGAADQVVFAVRAALFLGGVCLVAGALVLLLDGGWTGLRRGLPFLLGAGIPMAGALVLTASAVPAVATLASGGVGLLATMLLSAASRRRAPGTVAVAATTWHGDPSSDSTPPSARSTGPAEPDAPAALRTLAPYLYLLLTALPVFLWPRSRAWVTDNLVLAPAFPATETGLGWVNDAAGAYTPVALLGHPGFYILLAAVLGVVTYRIVGLWPRGAFGGMIASWLRSLPQSSSSILLLACLATVLVDSGMVSVLATGTAAVTGAVFPAISPLVGAMGSFVTGSTTASNALFAALQADLARLVEVEPTWLLTAQTVGGNIGNSVAPVVMLVGLSAVDATDSLSEVLRLCLRPAALLLLLVVSATVVLAHA